MIEIHLNVLVDHQSAMQSWVAGPGAGGANLWMINRWIFFETCGYPIFVESPLGVWILFFVARLGEVELYFDDGFHQHVSKVWWVF